MMEYGIKPMQTLKFKNFGKEEAIQIKVIINNHINLETISNVSYTIKVTNLDSQDSTAVTV